MTVAGLDREVVDAAKAIGLVEADGNLDATWFANPLDHVRRLLKNPAQRQALLDLVDSLRPREPVGGAPDEERWHPLLNGGRAGNVFLTVRGDAGDGPVRIGIAAEVQGLAGAGDQDLSASLTARLPLIESANGNLEAIAGTSSGPLAVDVRIGLHWTRPTHAIGLDALRVSIMLAGLDMTGPEASLRIMLEKLDLGDGTVQDEVPLDPTAIGAKGVHVVVALLRQRLRLAVAEAALPPDVATLAAVLVDVLGLDPEGPVPPLPIERLLAEPAALRDWLTSVTGDAGSATAWLEAVGHLFSGSAQTIAGSGTGDDPWRVPLIDFGPAMSGTVDLTLARIVDPATRVETLEIGAVIAAAPDTAAKPVRLEASVTFAAVPLGGSEPARVLPRVDVGLRSPGGPGRLHGAPNSPFTVGAILGGLSWDGASVRPRLELLDLVFEGRPHDRIDLTNADSVVEAGVSVLIDAIEAALGTAGTGAHALALLGLAAPGNAPGWPSTLRADAGAFAANPMAEIGRVHREILNDPVHTWAAMFSELAALAGFPGVVAGVGTPADPWRVPLASQGALSVELAAWDESGPPASGEPHRLRIGVRLDAESAPWLAAWTMVLVAFDLPPAAPAQAHLLTETRLVFQGAPLPAPPEHGGVQIRADSFDIVVEWVAGAPLAGRARVANLVVADANDSVTIPALSFPPPAAGTATNPLAAFGLTDTQAETLLRLAARRGSVAWGGVAGAALGSVAGLFRGLDDLPEDWPRLAGGPAGLFRDSPAELRDLLHRILTTAGTDGEPFAATWLEWLARLLTATLPDVPGDEPPPAEVGGFGTRADPWALPLAPSGGSVAEVLVWLEPDGPPPALAAAAADRLAASADFPYLVDRLVEVAPLVPGVAAALDGRPRGLIAAALDALAAHLTTTDGLVPVVSQAPTEPGWAAGGTRLRSAHAFLPSDTDAITQIRAQVDSWSPAAVLLLSPAFGSSGDWQRLIAAAEAADPGSTSPAAHFDFRQGGLALEAVDVTQVTTPVGWYTADLADPGSADQAAVAAQIAKAIDRVRELHAGASVAVVAHSTTGVAARQFVAAAPPGAVVGLITLGSPLLGAPIPPLTDPTVADAVRIVQRLLPDGSNNPALDAALGTLTRALDGYRPAASAAGLPVAAPFPIASFTGSADLTLNGVPALALVGELDVDLLAAVRQGVAALATAAATSRAEPTHLGLGIRADLALPGGGRDGGVDLDADVRVDLGRIRFVPPAAEPPPAHRVTVRARIHRPNAWLVGDPSADVRLRLATLSCVLEPTADGVAVTPDLHLVDASLRGVARDAATLADPIAQGVVGELFRTLTVPAPSAGGAIEVLLGALQRLGVVVPDPHAGMGLSLDGLTALTSDPRGYLAPRFTAALAGDGILGLTGPPDGPWSVNLDDGLELSLRREGWHVRLRTLDAGIDLAGPILELDVEFGLVSGAAVLEAGLAWGPIRIRLEYPDGGLHVAAEPWLPQTDLLLPGGGESALVAAAPDFLLSVALGALLETSVGPEFSILPLSSLLRETGAWLSGPHAFGAHDSNGAAAPGFDAARLTALLNGLADAAGFEPGSGVILPGDVELAFAGGDPLVFSLQTRTPINNLLDLALTASVDARRHVTPGGALNLTVQLPADAVWPSLTVAAGTGPEGLTLAVVPSGATPIQLLPRFSGFGALASAVTTLLPAVLDRLRAELGPTPATRSRLMQLVLDVCEAVGLYDEAGGFAAHAPALASAGGPGWLEGLGTTARTETASRLALLAADPGSPLAGLPGAVTVDAAAPAVVWTWTPTGSGGSLGVRLGWHGTGAQVGIGATDLRLSGSPVTIDLSAGVLDGAVAAAAGIRLDAGAALGFPFRPRMEAQLDGGRFRVSTLPVAGLEIQLAPDPQIIGGVAGLEAVVREWLFPLVVNLAVGEARDVAGAPLTTPLFSGGKTVEEVLLDAGILDAGGAVRMPLPASTDIVRGALAGLVGAGVDIASGLHLSFVEGAGSRLGVRLTGAEEIPAGDYSVSIRFGGPASWIGADGGVTIFLLDLAVSPVRMRPALEVVGLGAALKRSEDAPLVDSSAFRLGAVDAYIFFDVELAGGVSVAGMGGGVELESVSIPLGQASKASSTANPVAASMLGPEGTGGDQRHAAPSVDVVAFKRGSDPVRVLIEGQTGAFWIPVHRSFGPLYVDEIGVDQTPDPGVKLLFDGGLEVGPLTAQVDDLAVIMPFADLLDPGDWRLDLKGLAVGFDSSGVKIAGGLVKSDGPPIEYDGMLMVNVANLAFAAVGSYARPADAQGGYTSFFGFVALPVTIGGPPFFFITGLGGGIGLNRELHVPDDFDQIPGFLLVAAIDDNSLANDPMAALLQVRGAIPPARGAFWLAAGLRFTTFVLLHSTAVVYLALNRGVDIGLLGVSRMVLPSDDAPIVSVELALKARYSTAEELLSVQAQLTDNSWLFSPNCQLTGGFAYFMWFRESQFVLTMGGYHPHFQRPERFPDVPRLGFHWQVSGKLVVKGEAYFALTNTCVMAGGRLEATYHSGGLRAWFTAYADLVVAWDPFSYDVGLGVSVGIAWHGEVCFFYCTTIDIDVSVGARLHLMGPPLHGSVTVDYWFISVTIPFGDSSVPIDYIHDYARFALKYLILGDPTGTCVGLRVGRGLLPPDPPGAQSEPGSRDQPWKLAAEFALVSETRLPAHSFDDLLGTGRTSPEVGRFDLAPMAKRNAETTHGIRLTARDSDSAFPVDPAHWEFTPILGWVPDATWRFVDPHDLRPGAGKLRAITGIAIIGKAVAVGQSALIPWATLVYDSIEQARPLPIAPLDNLGSELKKVGAVADDLIALARSAPPETTGALIAMLLAGEATTSGERRDLGLAAAAAGPLRLRSVSRERSAPPLVAPLSSGLTQKPVGLPPAPAVAARPSAEPLVLVGPRLRAVLQARPEPAQAVAPARRTSVMGVKAANGVPRIAPPRPAAVRGARLVRVAAPGSPRPTSAAVGTRTLSTPERGNQANAGLTAELSRLTREAIGGGAGAELAAGTTHIWELPGDLEDARVIVSGEDGARVSCLAATGELLHDVEGVAPTVNVPHGTDFVVVSCLGRVPEGLGAAPGAITGHVAAAGATAATGWQSGGLVQLVSSARALCRGGAVILPAPFVPCVNRQATTQTIVRLDPALGDAKGIETWLPIATDVVMVILEERDAEAAAAGDVAVAADGARLVGPPLAVISGRRRALLYEVTARDRQSNHLVVAVASAVGWRLAGVVGLAGRAIDWATRFAGGVPEHIVPDGPLTPDGSVRVRIDGADLRGDHDPVVFGVAGTASGFEGAAA